MKVSSEPYKHKLPPPFERPMIEISAVGREWQWVAPEQIKENDIIPDFGRIKYIEHYAVSDPREEVIKIVGTGKTETFQHDALIWAFTRKPT